MSSAWRKRLSTAAGRPVRSVRRFVAGPGAFVLMYHRVAEGEVDPWGLCVAPEHFDAHLAVLRRRACPMPLLEFARSHADGTLPRNAVAITFDDGYADNLHAARPILARNEVPATVFLSTGYAGHGRPFWWDALAHTLLHPHPLPEVLDLDFGGDRFYWTLGAAAAADATDRSAWRAGREAPSLRQDLFLELWRRMGSLPGDTRGRLLAELAIWAGVGPDATALRALTREEVGALVDGDLVAVGAHTVSHPALPDVPPERQYDEIVRSKLDVEELLGHPVATFSYPHGRHAPDTVELVREAGFEAACCSPDDALRCDLARHRADPLLIPRVYVGNWDGPTFERRLIRGFEG